MLSRVLWDRERAPAAGPKTGSECVQQQLQREQIGHAAGVELTRLDSGAAGVELYRPSAALVGSVTARLLGGQQPPQQQRRLRQALRDETFAGTCV